MTKIKAVLAEAVWQDDKLRMVDQFAFVTQVRNMGLGEGETVSVRVERPEDARTGAQHRKYFALVHDISEHTGYTTIEVHRMLDVELLPPGKTSITQLSKEEMSAHIEGVLRFAAEQIDLVLDRNAA